MVNTVAAVKSQTIKRIRMRREKQLGKEGFEESADVLKKERHEKGGRDDAELNL